MSDRSVPPSIMGAPPALLWAADHPDEVERLFYGRKSSALKTDESRLGGQTRGSGGHPDACDYSSHAS